MCLEKLYTIKPFVHATSYLYVLLDFICPWVNKVTSYGVKDQGSILWTEQVSLFDVHIQIAN